MVTFSLVQLSWLMSALTSGLGTRSSLAIAYKLLSWADRAESLSLQGLSSWRLDGVSFLLGLSTGVILFCSWKFGLLQSSA